MEVSEYISKFKRLIALERDAEINFHTEEIKSISAFAREKKGRCLTGMKRQENQKLEGDSVFRFVKDDKNPLPVNEMNIGSNVLISTSDPLNDSIKGIVRSKSQFSIDIYIPSQSNILYRKNIRIDMFVNDTTFETQKNILENMTSWKFEKRQIRDIILHTEKPTLGENVQFNFEDTTLNDSQRLAVKYSMREEEFYLIQGPPGTGKTKTSIEIIRQHIKLGKKVLVSADSNMAVDNIMLGILKDLEVIRIGESPKILPEIQEHTLGKVIEGHIRYGHIKKALERITELRELQRKETVPSRNNAKGISHFQLLKLAERGQEEFGIDKDTIKSMANWIKLQGRIKTLQKDIDEIKTKIIKDSINRASVICTTNSNANSPYISDIEFDLVLIDEAGQSTEPSCLIPISRAKKVIMVGDHKQLPPTILSEKADELSISLFERMFGKVRHTMLNTQYRMNPLINEFPSGEFYDNQLKSGQGTEDHEISKSNKIFEKPVTFIEVKGKEEKKKGATSYYNSDESEVVFELVRKYSRKGIDNDDIGIISPYLGQVRILKEQMPFIEVNSVDGFQGREKNMIILSLVRSNKNNQMGFLKDLRRLNVALTRARNELVVIGNPDTIKSNKTYNNFLNFVKEKGTYVSETELATILKD